MVVRTRATYELMFNRFTKSHDSFDVKERLAKHKFADGLKKIRQLTSSSRNISIQLTSQLNSADGSHKNPSLDES